MADMPTKVGDLRGTVQKGPDRRFNNYMAISVVNNISKILSSRLSVWCDVHEDDLGMRG